MSIPFALEGGRPNTVALFVMGANRHVIASRNDLLDDWAM